MLTTRPDEWTDRVTDKFWPICQTANNKIQFSCKKFCTNSTGKLVYSDSGHTKELTPSLCMESLLSPLPPTKLVQVRQLPFASRSFSSCSCSRKVAVLSSCIMHQKCWRYQLFHLPTVQRVSALIYPFLSG